VGVIDRRQRVSGCFNHFGASVWKRGTEFGNSYSGHYTSIRFNRNQKLAKKTQSAVVGGSFSAKGFRFAIVASRWNDAIVSRLIDGAQKALKQASAADDAIELFRVPGAFEIPLCAQKAAESKKFDAVICLGVVIRGDTPHFEYIAASTARGISEASLRTGVPLLFGVITADNVEQADERSRDDENNKGLEAAMAAVELANLYRNVLRK
jgi:6,7-dimethyl-8-ribityllumazine synthase